MLKKPSLFWLLLILFLTPFIAASLLFHNQDHFQFATKNKGTLINPPAHFSDLTINDTANTFEGFWWIIIISPTCKTECQQSLHWTHQIHTALHKYSPRVKRLLLTQNAKDGRSELSPYNDSPDVHVENIVRLPSFITQPSIVLMDPHGNIMLQYSLDEDPNHLLKDLKFLLKHSQIG